MNARLYDPRIGKFFSPDNVISSPENPQDYNRYTYAHNNPLSYTDPSGNFEIVSTVLLMYSIYSATINTIQAIEAGGVKAGLINIGATAVSAAISYGVGYGINAGLSGNSIDPIGALLLNAASGVISGQLTSAVFGSKYTGDMALQSIGFSMLAWGAQSIESYIDLNAEAGATGVPPTPEQLERADYYNKNEAPGNQNTLNKRSKDDDLKGIRNLIKKKYSLTSRIPRGYGLDADGVIIAPDGDRRLAETRGSFTFNKKTGEDISATITVCVSPYVINGSRGTFIAFVGHELIHVYHYSIFGYKTSIYYSEVVAFEYSVGKLKEFGELYTPMGISHAEFGVDNRYLGVLRMIDGGNSIYLKMPRIDGYTMPKGF